MLTPVNCTDQHHLIQNCNVAKDFVSLKSIIRAHLFNSCKGEKIGQINEKLLKKKKVWFQFLAKCFIILGFGHKLFNCCQFVEREVEREEC